jgi:hypothetical protein
VGAGKGGSIVIAGTGTGGGRGNWIDARRGAVVELDGAAEPSRCSINDTWHELKIWSLCGFQRWYALASRA